MAKKLKNDGNKEIKKKAEKKIPLLIKVDRIILDVLERMKDNNIIKNKSSYIREAIRLKIKSDIGFDILSGKIDEEE